MSSHSFSSAANASLALILSFSFRFVKLFEEKGLQETKLYTVVAMLWTFECYKSFLVSFLLIYSWVELETIIPKNLPCFVRIMKTLNAHLSLAVKQGISCRIPIFYPMVTQISEAERQNKTITVVRKATEDYLRQWLVHFLTTAIGVINANANAKAVAMKQSKGKWETVFFLPLLWYGTPRCIHRHDSQLCELIDLIDRISQTRKPTHKFITLKCETTERKNQDFVSCNCKRLQAKILTSSPQCGQFPFRAVKSFLHNPLSTLTTKHHSLSQYK